MNLFHVVVMVMKFCSIAVPAAGKIKPIMDSSGSMDENYSKFAKNMKSLQALKEVLKNKTTKSKSKTQQIMDDWFNRVMTIENLADDIVSTFQKIQPRLAWYDFILKARISRDLVNMCVEIHELATEGYHLAVISALEEVATTIELRILKIARICIAVLCCSCLFIIIARFRQPHYNLSGDYFPKDNLNSFYKMFEEK